VEVLSRSQTLSTSGFDWIEPETIERRRDEREAEMNLFS